MLPERQGTQLSSVVINSMRDVAREAGLRELAAPVRPTLKADYPLIPIQSYLELRRDDGSHFDPWLRIHERLGGRVVAAAPESMNMESPAADWEEWTGMPLPEDGTYIVPGAPRSPRGPRRGRHARRSQSVGGARGLIRLRPGA